MQHVMIDLETLGTLPGSVILSVGAVLFDPAQPPYTCLGETFYRVVNQNSCQEAGLTTSQSTLDWWLKQPPEARTVLAQSEDPKQSAPLAEVLLALAAFIPANAKVWSNGANFDQPLLDVAYSKFDLSIPWKYYNSRCHRTVVGLHPNEKALHPPTVLAHNALEDAKWQAKHLVNIAHLLDIRL
ncbi:MAG: 3'-5' exonuclease [Bellilinea sp.]